MKNTIKLFFFLLINFYNLNAQVVINEVMPVPSGGNTDGCIQSMFNTTNLNCGKEWIELFNTSTCDTIDLSCYMIGAKTSGTNYGVFVIPNGIKIPPLGFLSIGGAASGATISLPSYQGQGYLCAGGSRWFLENTTGWVGLYAPNGNPVNSVYWSFSANDPNVITSNSALTGTGPQCIPTNSCATVTTLAGISSMSSSVRNYAGQVPQTPGTTIKRTTDGASTWATTSTPTINACNGTCITFTPFVLNSTVTQPACDNSNGSISFNPTPAGTYTYTWSPNVSSTSSATNLAANTYTISINGGGCVKDTTITLNATGTVTPSVSIAASNSTICTGANVTFTATPTNGGTTPSYQWQLNGANVGTNSATYSNNTLTNGSVVTVIMTSNAACASPTTATSNQVTMTVGSVAPSVSIAATNSTICSGTNVTFTATPTNGGTTPSYQWQLNGTNVGTNSATYSNNALTNGSVITVIMTSNAACASPTTATSNQVTMTVGSVAPSVSIAASNSSICTGANVIFTATPTNGGSTPSYQWQLNGVNVGTNSATYSNNALTNGSVVTVIMTSNAACASPTTATSNQVTITVGTVAPSVSIAASNSTICTGANVTFTATPTNGGTTPSYQWQLNGTNVGTNSATYSNNALTNGSVITVIMTSNAACASPTTATSNQVTMTVGSVAPSVSIAASNSSICTGANVIFTATPTNGGSTPSYQWQLNGVNVGTNSATYSNNTLTNGSVVTVIMTSNAACASPTTATSNQVTMTVSSVTPSVSIAASNSTICTGANVTFTATPTNGGTTPSYQWQLNGANVGTNSSTYSNNGLVNGDIVTLVMTSNAACASPTTATSNQVSMTVNSVTPSVTIAANSTTICTGTSVNLTATPTNGGTTPSYQWQLNGTNVGTNSSTYSNAGLVNGDIVTVVLTSSDACASPTTATSNQVSMTVNSVTPSVTIAANSTTICAGTSVTFTATPTNGGTTPSYQWQLNGTNDGTNSSTYSNTGLVNGDIVTVVLTSSDACANPTSATSNQVSMTVNSVTPSVVLLVSDDTVCAGTNVVFTASPTNGGTSPSYQWQLNGSNVGTNNVIYSNSSLSEGDVITVLFTSNAQCATSSNVSSNPISMTVQNSVIPSISTDDSVKCIGGSVQLTASGASSYQWLVNGSPISSTQSSISVNQNGNYSVIGFTNIGCADTSRVQNVKFNANPTVSAGLGGSICLGMSFTLKGNSSVTSFAWTDKNNKLISNSVLNPTVTPDSTSEYTITVTDSEGCTNSSKVKVEVKAVVVARISVDYQTSLAPFNLKFYNTTENADRYEWDFGDGNTSTEKEPTHEYATEGKYEVTLRAFSGECYDDTVLKFINVIKLKIPTAISPNGDLVNDKWIIDNIDLFPLNEVEIYNQWGNIVYKTRDYQNDFNGSNLPDATYFYVLKLGNDIKPMQGFLMIMR
jgi:gliding motility-associated-like protein